MKVFFRFFIFSFSFISFQSPGFTQTNTSDPKKITALIKKENHDLILLDSASFLKNGYHHLDGKIGNSYATIDINNTGDFTAYVYSDSLQIIEGFSGTYNKGFLIFYFDDYVFGENEWRISSFILGIKKDSGFVGYFICDSLKKIVASSFKEDYRSGSIRMTQLDFEYQNKYKNFPVYLSEHIFFADTSNKTEKIINNLLLNNYELIGDNYRDDISTLSFSSILNLRNPKSYSEYAKRKFIMCYKKIITPEFLRNARESGHTDIYLNSLHPEILCNDGKYLVLQITMNFADGDVYPYYDTYIFEFDLQSKKMILNNSFISDFNITDKSTSIVINNLQKVHRYDSANDIDKWFFEKPKIAFIMKAGLVFVKRGDNHGIHNFYRYIPNKFIKPYLNN